MLSIIVFFKFITLLMWYKYILNNFAIINNNVFDIILQ